MQEPAGHKLISMGISVFGRCRRWLDRCQESGTGGQSVRRDPTAHLRFDARQGRFVWAGRSCKYGSCGWSSRRNASAGNRLNRFWNGYFSGAAGHFNKLGARLPLDDVHASYLESRIKGSVECRLELFVVVRARIQNYLSLAGLLTG